MPTYIRVCRLTKAGMNMADRPADLFGQIKGTLEGSDCTLVHAWVTIGAYDFVSVVDAPSEAAMKKAAEATNRLGYYTVRSVSAYTVDSFVKWADGEFSPFLQQWMNERKKARGIR